MSEKSFDELCEEISAQVGSPTLLVGDKLKPVLNQHFFARFAAAKYNPVYEILEEVFYIYSPETGLWEPQDGPSMIDLISTTMMLFAQEKGDAIVNAKRGVVVIRQILEFMKAKNCCGRTNAFARKGEPFIHCKNGVITFPKQEDGCRKPVLKPFDPKYMSRNRTEIEYHEAAVCNEFKTRLLEPALSKDDIAHLQLYFGQCLLGINSSQTFLLMIGTPGGGKSTFVNVVEKAVNRQNCTELRLRHLADSRFETQRLLGKTLLTAKDVPSNFFSTSGWRYVCFSFPFASRHRCSSGDTKQKRAASTHCAKRGSPKPEQPQRIGPQKCRPSRCTAVLENWRFRFVCNIQPRKIRDYVRIKLSRFVPCTSCSGVDGYVKLPCNILHRGAFFKCRTFFSGICLAVVRNSCCLWGSPR